jgi:hypothetical protein
VPVDLLLIYKFSAAEVGKVDSLKAKFVAMLRSKSTTRLID